MAKSSCGERKQFPLNTKGCCFICLNRTGSGEKRGSTSLVDLCHYLEIDMKQVYQKSLSSKNLPTSTAAEEFEKAETRGQLCPKCSELIVESVECYRQLELIEMKRKACLTAILECFKEEVKSKLGEEFRRMMTSDKFASPYLAIVTELRKQIGIKCSSEVGESSYATPHLAKSYSVRQGHQARTRIADGRASYATRRNIQIKESQLITVPTTALPTQIFTEEVSDEDMEILEPKEEVKEEHLLPSPPIIEIASDDDKVKEEEEEQIISGLDPLEEPEPPPVFSITVPPLSKSVVSEISGIPCKLCKTPVTCASFQHLRQHYNLFHPNVKLATKCNLCKFFEGNHENCQGRPRKKKSTAATRARRFLQAQQSLKRKKVALETAQAPSPLKAKRKSSHPKREPLAKKRSSKAEVSTPKTKKLKQTPADNDSSRPPTKRQIKYNWDGISPSQFEFLPDLKVKCLVCARTFIRKEFKRHFYAVHLRIIARRKYPCDMCDVKFSQKRLVERHKQVIHLGIGSYQKHRQRKKQRTFDWKDIDPSQYEALPDSKVKCLVCTKTFIPKEFRNHFLRVHLKIKKHACDICDDKFSQKSLLERHKQVIHLGIGSYQKNRPGFVNVWDPTKERKKARRKPTLSKTKKEKRFMCEHGCGEMFYHQYKRQQHHDKVHLGVKYMCDACGKCFADEVCLRGHKRSMHGEGGEKYQCDVCGKRYYDKCTVLEHKRSMHEGQKFSCQVPGCTSVVKWKSNLIHHMKKFHPDYSTKPIPNGSNEEPSKN